MVTADLLMLAVDKVKIPHMMKGGIIVSIFAFQVFDINRRVKKKMGY